MKVELGLVGAFFEAVGRIGEEEGAAFGEDEVVGAVEAFAFESVGENGEGATASVLSSTRTLTTKSTDGSSG